MSNFTEVLIAKKVPKPVAVDFTNFFLAQFDALRKTVPNGISIPDWITGLAEENIDLNKSLGYYMKVYLVKMQLRNAAKMMGVDPGLLLGHIGPDDVRVINLSTNLKSELELLLGNDSRRPIETSAMTDIHLATYSLFIETCVDKRTMDLARRANSTLRYDLKLQQVSYDLFR